MDLFGSTSRAMPNRHMAPGWASVSKVTQFALTHFFPPLSATEDYVTFKLSIQELFKLE